MKFSKLLLAVVGATVLLGALVASASANTLEGTQTTSALWTSMRFSGGFGVVECEVKISGSFHARTIAKSVESLIGYITEATVLRCARGSATVIQTGFPWHRRYSSFTGTLPIITGLSETVHGAEWFLREPFGGTCQVRRESSQTIGTYEITNGTPSRVTRATVSGESPCEGAVRIRGRLSGETGNVGTITVRLHRLTPESKP